MCPLCGLTKTDLRVLSPPSQAPMVSRAPKKTQSGKCKGGEDYVVIVGAGIAAWSVAEEIRRRDADTPVLMVTACEGFSYPKPALSTALAQGKSIDDLVDQDGASKAEQLAIDIRTETRVIKIDTAKKKLTTAKGAIQYGKLVLALGAHQRELSVTGNAADTVIRVNDLASYRKFRKRLEDHVQHVTILGAGLIGCEFAEDLAATGYSVTIVDPADCPMSALIPSQTASRLENRLKQNGIQWLLGQTLDELDQSGERLRATMANGVALETDLVLSAAGLVANTQLGEKAGIAVNHGIIVDRQMKTSNADVFAIGDCAEVEGRLYAYIEPIRRQALAIAANLRGEDIPFEPKPPLVRVKTPSFPLTVCSPDKSAGLNPVVRMSDDEDRIEYLEGDELVGFVLSGEQSQSASQLYKQMTN
jgi:rubredoxin-NAD+ reductase